MKKPKYFPKLTAWYYRNIKYKDRLFDISFADYKPELFEVLYTTNGIVAVYLGKGKYYTYPKGEAFGKKIKKPRLQIKFDFEYI